MGLWAVVFARARDSIESMSASKKPTVRKVAVYGAGLAVFVLASPTPELFAVGAAIALAGEGLRLWACGHLRKNQAVIKSGPYAHVKNPLYLGTFLIMVGCIVAATNPADPSRYLLLVALPCFLGVFFVYYLPYKFAREGDRLRRRFGEEWDRYASAVPDFVPRLTPFARSSERWKAGLVVENSEVSAAVWVLLALCVLGARFVPWA